MAAVTYYVVKNAEPHAKLKEELRSRFKSLVDIDITSTGQLPYLQAVIKDTLRIFSTSPQGLPHRSPGIEVDGHFVPEGVSLSLAPLFHLHSKMWTNYHKHNISRPSSLSTLGPHLVMSATSTSLWSLNRRDGWTQTARITTPRISHFPLGLEPA
jgi:cytochrome P450